MAGAPIGTFICPGPGTVVGGIVGAIGTDLVMAPTGLTDALAEYLQPGVESVRKARVYVQGNGYQVTVAAREQLPKWIGTELFDNSVASLGTTVTWAQDSAWDAVVVVNDAAVSAKDKGIDLTGQACDAVASGAAWT